jgi:alkylation response protein AidB-like acyl-CoA dehydrogenase
MIDTLAALRDHAGAADANLVWPELSWDALRRGGVLGWCIPNSLGGDGRDGLQLLDGYEQLASACLTTCFILSQRDAACRRLRDSGNEALARQLLPALAQGRHFATVGVSQLTTSRQHGKPAMLARASGQDFVMDGVMPWVTGAARADYFVTGAVLEDGRQILAVLHRDRPGVVVGPPLELTALQGSLTAEVRCEKVLLERRWLLAGPVEKVMAPGKGGAGGLETSCLALGLAGAAIEFLEQEVVARPELKPTTERLQQARTLLRDTLHQAAKEGATADMASSLRARANTLVLRATQAALTASKGVGFLRNHPAQRWARQALFFLVWSCPRPAVEATMAYLTPDTCDA